VTLSGISSMILALIALFTVILPNFRDNDTKDTPRREAVTTPQSQRDKAPGDLLVGAYYRLSPGSDVLFQVVDRQRDQDLQRPTLWNPLVLWIDTDGNPVLNPNRPPDPAISEVSRAFGSPRKVIAYVRATLEPL